MDDNLPPRYSFPLFSLGAINVIFDTINHMHILYTEHASSGQRMVAQPVHLSVQVYFNVPDTDLFAVRQQYLIGGGS